MSLFFVYGSLEQGFANAHINPGRRVAGRYHTRERYRLYLLSEGEVPCFVAPQGSGYRVIGELYEVNNDEFHCPDQLERVFKAMSGWKSPSSTSTGMSAKI